MTETLAAIDAPALPQTRHLATSIPGPRSAVLHEQRVQQVSSGFGITLPVFVNRADGGIIEDVDGNRLIAWQRVEADGSIEWPSNWRTSPIPASWSRNTNPSPRCAAG